MTDDRFRYQVSAGIATVTIDRAAKLNALLPDMILEFSDLLERARRDRTVRCVVIRGDGKSFCAGDDLHPEDRFKYGPPDMHTRLKMGYPRLVNDILQLRKPVVAMVRGYAVGAGFDVALACDFRIASPTTKMAAIFVRRGLGGGCSYLLPRYVGFGKATELLLLGEMIEAEEALGLGLLTRIVPDGDLEAESDAFARRLAKGPTQAYGASRTPATRALAAIRSRASNGWSSARRRTCFSRMPARAPAPSWSVASPASPANGSTSNTTTSIRTTGKRPTDPQLIRVGPQLPEPGLRGLGHRLRSPYRGVPPVIDVVEHDPDAGLEVHLGCPAKNVAGPGGVGLDAVGLCGALRDLDPFAAQQVHQAVHGLACSRADVDHTAPGRFRTVPPARKHRQRR